MAGSTREAQEKARKELAVLKDRWWESRADHLQRAADEGNRCLVHQLLDEIVGPTKRRFVALPFPGTNRRTKTAKESAEAFRAHFEMVLNQDRQEDESVPEEMQQRVDSLLCLVRLLSDWSKALWSWRNGVQDVG